MLTLCTVFVFVVVVVVVFFVVVNFFYRNFVYFITHNLCPTQFGTGCQPYWYPFLIFYLSQSRFVRSANLCDDYFSIGSSIDELRLIRHVRQDNIVIYRNTKVRSYHSIAQPITVSMNNRNQNPSHPRKYDAGMYPSS